MLEKDLKKKKLFSFFWEGEQRIFQVVKHFTNLSAEASYLSTGRFMNYSLCDYLPFSNNEKKEENKNIKFKTTYEEYQSAKDFYGRIEILERVIISHLVLMSYGTEWELKPRQRLKVKLINILDIGEGFYKKQDPKRAKHYLKLDIQIAINADIPDGISIGNQKSLGYGVLEKVEE